MNLRYRKLISRVKPLHKLLRIIWYNSGYFSYLKIFKENGYRAIFDSLKDSCKGKRCFIIGNGPSLRADDLDKIKTIDSFGTNEIHRIYPITKWRPTYYLIMDRYSKTIPQQIRDLECDFVFLGDYYCRFNKVIRKDAIRLHQRMGFNEDSYIVSQDISSYITNSPTVSFGAMQIAAYLGYSEIYLLGFDHNYSFEFSPDGAVIKTQTNASHFFRDDVPEDIIANVWGMQKSYESFREYADRNGIVVMNATRGGKLDVFDRIDFDSLISRESEHTYEIQNSSNYI